jgi:hypothetical protein
VLLGQETGCTSAMGVDVSPDGNVVYIACASDENFANALRIVDATDKTNPVVIGSVALPGASDDSPFNTVYSVVADGAVAYVGNDYGIDEVDIADPTAPAFTTRHETGYSVRSVTKAPDGRVFAFAGEAGVFVYTTFVDSIFEDGFE